MSESTTNHDHPVVFIHGPWPHSSSWDPCNLFKSSPNTVDTPKAERSPLLLTSGSENHTAPKVVVEQPVNLYAGDSKSVTEYHEFEGRGHSLTIDEDWDDVANVTLQWLSSKGF